MPIAQAAVAVVVVVVVVVVVGGVGGGGVVVVAAARRRLLLLPRWWANAAVGCGITAEGAVVVSSKSSSIADEQWSLKSGCTKVQWNIRLPNLNGCTSRSGCLLEFQLGHLSYSLNSFKKGLFRELYGGEIKWHTRNLGCGTCGHHSSLTAAQPPPLWRQS